MDRLEFLEAAWLVVVVVSASMVLISGGEQPVLLCCQGSESLILGEECRIDP